MIVVFLWGAFCTALLVLLPGPIFRIFIPEAKLQPMGIGYLRILGVSQLFMCVEIATQGAFGGLAKTVPPSLISIIFTAVRIPLAILLSTTALGLTGVWWSISISSILKGVILVSWFLYILKKYLDKQDSY